MAHWVGGGAWCEWQQSALTAYESPTLPEAALIDHHLRSANKLEDLRRWYLDGKDLQKAPCYPPVYSNQISGHRGN